ncbi:MAG TPA: DUF2306 domain-containing protein [Flavisolibacter sp.]|nr:DUF2306 domain-containing protein [Flavisolibacter sp.]
MSYSTIHPRQTKALQTSARIFRGSGVLLVTTVWVSAGLFGLYILAFYASALYSGNMEKWNGILPGLYQKNSLASTSGIGLHFATGGIILLLGSIQLISAVRKRFPALHRWVGRLYILSSLLAALGGLIFIVVKGTIGGTVMNIGFGLYGVLMFAAAIETYRQARAGQMEKHRAWALRLYALAIGSWLYRMDYGFWLLLADGLGHLDNFTGPFDRVMAFFFYLPNLLVAEVFIRSRSRKASVLLNAFSTLMVLVITAFLLVGTYFFTKFYWGPAILRWISGS